MERGETNRHFHFLHSKLPSKFFCQDVVCHNWPFVHVFGFKLTQYSKLTSECSPFLSRWHGKTHSWPCQVIIFVKSSNLLHFLSFQFYQILWSGHWKKGAAATLGEEQEQVFSTMSRYGSCTKHMSDACKCFKHVLKAYNTIFFNLFCLFSARRDHLSAAILYQNERKNDTIDKILVARLLKVRHSFLFFISLNEFQRTIVSQARKQAPIHRQELQKLLKRKWISEKDLPFILEELKIKAIESNSIYIYQIGKQTYIMPIYFLDKLASSNWALSYERGDLEGTYLHIKRIERRIALIVGG